MQEELIKVLTTPNCHLKNLSLIHSGLKPDFFHKMQIYLQSNNKYNSTNNFLTNLRTLNFSKNSVEDRGLTLFINLCKEYGILHHMHSNCLTSMLLAKCSLSTKSVNHMFSTIGFPVLNHLDLSFNYLKDEPTVF